MLDCFRGSVLGSLIAAYESGGQCFLGDVRGWLPWGLLSADYMVFVAEGGEELGKKLLGWKCGMDRGGGQGMMLQRLRWWNGGLGLGTGGEFGSRQCWRRCCMHGHCGGECLQLQKSLSHLT